MTSSAPVAVSHCGQQWRSRPEKRHALNITEKKWGTDWQERTAEIADGEDEKRDVHRVSATAVHAQKGAEQKHRRTNRADKICQDAAAEQQRDICEREAGRGMCKWIAPATTKNAPTTTMKVAYSPAAC